MELPVLSNGVVTLRPWRNGDLKEMVAICQDEEIVRWTRVPSPYGEVEARKALADIRRSAEEGVFFGFAISDAVGEEVLGSIGLRVVDPSIGDIGYFVRVEARRRGTGRTALELLCRWAFPALGFARLQITIHPENLPSRRLAESCGFHCEGVLRAWLVLKDERVDAAMYSLLPGELD